MIEHNPYVPVGYKVQLGIPCCANCMFGGYLGSVHGARMCICEIHGEPESSNYFDIAVEPLGICDAYKPQV